MNIRPKTVRRLLVLLVAVGLLLGAGAAVYQHHQRSKQRQILAEAVEGKEAFKQGDFPTALRKLSGYTRTHKDDIDALFAHAVARSRVELPHGEHIQQAIPLLNEVLSLKPDHLGAAHELLELYPYVGRRQETIALANTVLEDHPDDTKALRAKADALHASAQLEEALQVAQRLNELSPKDLEGQFLTLDLLRRLKRPPQEVVERAQALAEKYPQDPRFELLLGYAHEYAGDRVAAVNWLRTAAMRKPPNAQFVRHAAHAFDLLKMYEESQALLERAATQSDDPDIRRVLVQRLWQNNRYQDVLKWVEDLDAASASPELLAFRAMSLYQLDRREEARAVAQQLSSREENSSSARAWSIALAARFAEEQPARRELITRYQNALSRDRSNGIIRAWIGDTYHQLGETELAIQHWREAAEAMPSWPMPHVLISRALLQDRPREALDAARIAWSRTPNNPHVAIAFAVASYRYAQEAPDAVDMQKLTEVLADIQRVLPGESETLPLHVDLQARAGGRDSAVAAVRAAIAPETKHGVETLRRLAQVSAKHNLGMESQILEKARSVEPHSPRNALLQAEAMAKSGKPDEALQALRQQAASAPKDQAMQWELAVAQFAEYVGDDSAKEAWIRIGDAYPKEIAIQKTILEEGRSARADREFTARTIDRLKALTGEEGIIWKRERARWLLGPDATPQDIASAITMLTDIVRRSPSLIEPRILLVEALIDNGNLDGAIGHLKAAVELDQRDPRPMIELSRLLQERGRTEEAGRYLSRLAENPALNLEQRRVVAAMLAQQGQIAPAVALLKTHREDPRSMLLLTELLRRSGDPAGAEQLFEQLLRGDQPSVQVIAAAADFYAATGHRDRAQEALAKLQQPSIATAQRELILAQFHERYSQQEQAALHFDAAASAAPNDPSVWQQVAQFHLRHQRYADAAGAAQRGLQHTPSSEPLQAMRREAQAREKAATSNDYQPLIDVLSQDPANAAEVATLKILRDHNAGRLAGAQLITALESAAREHPRYMPLQAMLVQEHLTRGNYEQGTRVAERAMAEMLNSAEAAKLATTAYKAAGRWLDMRRAAEAWRSRSLENPIQADVALAEAMVNLNDAGAAYNQLKGYLPAAAEEPQRYAPVLQVITRAMVAMGQTQQAQEILQPLVVNSPQWRAHWLRLAMSEIREPQRARQWVQTIEQHIPADSVDEQLNRARAWAMIASRVDARDGLERSRQAIERLQGKPDRDGEVLFTLGAIHQLLGDADAAEAALRKVVQEHPHRTDAKNDLAYLILTRAGDLEEARKLSLEAVQQAPAIPSYHDTLARIEWKLGNHDAALKAFDQALRYDPNYLEALVGKATVLTAAGDRVRASQVMTQIDAVLPAAPPPSEAIRQELDLLRASLTRMD